MTDISLRDYVDGQIAALRAELAVRHASAEKAIDRSEAAIEKRFDSVNEFREQLREQASTFLPRETFDTAVAEWSGWRTKVDAVLATSAGRERGISLSVGALAGGLAMVATVISIVIVLANVLTSK